MKAVINPDFSKYETFLKSLPYNFGKYGRTIYKARNEIKIIDKEELQLNVKSYKRPIFINRIAYTFFRKSKACRAFENATRIIELGFDTAEPVAFIETYSCGLLANSYFVSIHCPYTRNFREFADKSDISGREEIPVSFGRYAARMHKAGILHKDLSIGNILFEQESEDVKFCLVDLNRMDFCKINKDKGCKNFERLRGNDDFFRLLSKAYSEEMGYDFEFCFKTIETSVAKSVLHFRNKALRKKGMNDLRKRYFHH